MTISFVFLLLQGGCETPQGLGVLGCMAHCPPLPLPWSREPRNRKKFSVKLSQDGDVTIFLFFRYGPPNENPL